MFNDIEKIDRVLKPEPLKTNRDRSHQESARNTQPAVTAKEKEQEQEGEGDDRRPPQHLLDIRI
jgi:hypothetical protein